MRIDDNHLYHGAALLQITEHPTFTAINSIEVLGQRSRSAYRINDNIGIFLKYASKPPRISDHPFTFTSRHLEELAAIDDKMVSTFIALVCVEAREIACLKLEQLLDLVGRRKTSKGTSEAQYVVLVTATAGKQLRAHINTPGRKKTILGKEILIRRRAFPEALFV